MGGLLAQKLLPTPDQLQVEFLLAPVHHQGVPAHPRDVIVVAVERHVVPPSPQAAHLVLTRRVAHSCG